MINMQYIVASRSWNHAAPRLFGIRTINFPHAVISFTFVIAITAATTFVGNWHQDTSTIVRGYYHYYNKTFANEQPTVRF